MPDLAEPFAPLHKARLELERNLGISFCRSDTGTRITTETVEVLVVNRI
jgi:hypothetical protein